VANKFEIDTVTDDSGSLRIQVPGRPGRYHVQVTVVWDADADSFAWPPGWFEATAGAITDPTFVRPPQGEYEQREELG
jgi:hypothetical protein